MSLNDTTSDMIARIKNASKVEFKTLVVLYSKVNLNILKVLKDEGFIEDYHEVNEGNKKSIQIQLRYMDGEPSIKEIKMISTPGRPVHSSVMKLGRHKNGLGIKIVSTSQGIKSDFECMKLNIGGKVICKVF